MLLSDPIPLRTSEAINAYREAAALPWRFGDLSQSPQAVVQLSDTEFLWADHVAAVTGVQIDGQEVQGYGSEFVTDAAGITYTLITLTAPLPTGAQITATGTGLGHPRTGALIENPADVLEQIFVRSAYDISAALYQGLYVLRAQCAAEALTVAGSVSFAVTLRETINGLVRSIGGGWCSTGFWLYPSPEALATLSADEALPLPGAVVSSCVATVDASFDTLQIKFDDQAYAAAHRQSLVLRARPSLGIGRPTVTLLAGWLRSAHSATRVANRVLTRSSGEAYVITLECSPVEPPLAIGEVIPVTSPDLPRAGTWPVTLIAAERIGARIKFTAELIIPGPSLVFDIVSRTVAGAITQDDGVEVASSGTEHTFTVSDSTGKPVIGANVSLDNGPAKRTNAQGQVTFTADHGTHTLYITKVGQLPVALTVQL